MFFKPSGCFLQFPVEILKIYVRFYVKFEMRVGKNINNGNRVLILVPTRSMDTSPQNMSLGGFRGVRILSLSLLNQLHIFYVNLRKILKVKLENIVRSKI